MRKIPKCRNKIKRYFCTLILYSYVMPRFMNLAEKIPVFLSASFTDAKGPDVGLEGECIAIRVVIN